MKRTPKVNPEYKAIVDDIIAKKLPPQDALMEMLTRLYNVKFIDTNEKSNK